ncbi:MAG TPA: acyl-CoA thioesterase [bacterium]|nr:acyl-CoA thioesterase [bacterium]
MRPAPHLYRHRVRYADTDQMGVVYHARYLEWFEAARTEMLRDQGLPYKRLEEAGVSLPVIEAYCRYRFPVRYDDLVEVATQMGERSGLRFRLDYEVRVENDPALRIEGYTWHCYVGRHGRPIRPPAEFADFFERL